MNSNRKNDNSNPIISILIPEAIFNDYCVSFLLGMSFTVYSYSTIETLSES